MSKLSIITINYNDKVGLEKTIQSIIVLPFITVISEKRAPHHNLKIRIMLISTFGLSM